MTQRTNQERKFYFVRAYTGYAGEEQTAYYSAKSEEKINTFAQDLKNSVAYRSAIEHFWYDANEDETENEFLFRIWEDCGVEVKEITAEEYKAQEYKIWGLK